MTDNLLEYIPITEGTEFQWKSNSVLQVLSSESFWKWHVSVKKDKRFLKIQIIRWSRIFVRCQVLMATIIMTSIFWDVMPCSLEEILVECATYIFIALYDNLQMNTVHSSDTSMTQPIQRWQKFWTREI